MNDPLFFLLGFFFIGYGIKMLKFERVKNNNGWIIIIVGILCFVAEFWRLQE